jgi:hypothetical protein
MIEKEIAWERVAVVAAAVLFGILVICVVVAGVIAAVTAEKPIPPSSIRLIPAVVNVTVKPVPTWPVEVLQQVPTTLPTPEETLPVILKVPFDEEKSGIRNISEYFTIRRQNVSGYKSMTLKTTVYGSREYTQIKWYSDGYGKYLDQFAPHGEKYVFVFLAEYVDGNTPREDPGLWYFGPGQFRLQYDRRLYEQDPDFVPTNRVKELEEIASFNGIRGIPPFGYYIWQDAGTGQKTAVENPWIRMGQSNSVDGYLVYKVPEEYNVSRMLLVGNFASFGTAAWRLG